MDQAFFLDHVSLPGLLPFVLQLRCLGLRQGRCAHMQCGINPMCPSRCEDAGYASCVSGGLWDVNKAFHDDGSVPVTWQNPSNRYLSSPQAILVFDGTATFLVCVWWILCVNMQCSSVSLTQKPHALMDPQTRATNHPVSVVITAQIWIRTQFWLAKSTEVVASRPENNLVKPSAIWDISCRHRGASLYAS